MKNIFPNLILFPHGLHFSVTFTLFWMKQCCLEGTLAALLNVRLTGVITVVGVFGGRPMSEMCISIIYHKAVILAKLRDILKQKLKHYELSYHNEAD